MNKLGQISENRLIYATLESSYSGQDRLFLTLFNFPSLSPLSLLTNPYENVSLFSVSFFLIAALPIRTHPRTTARSVLPPLPSHYSKDLQKKRSFCQFPLGLVHWTWFCNCELLF